MRYTITPNEEDQCFDIRVQRGMNGQQICYQVATRDLLSWLQREVCSDHLYSVVLDTVAVDTPEPRYLATEPICLPANGATL